LRALILDDEKNIRVTLAVCLEGMGVEVTSVATPSAALAALAEDLHAIAFLDLRLGSDDGLEVLPQLLAASPGLSVVVITAFATIETAVEAMRRGAAEYLPKPFAPAQVRAVVERIVERRRTEERLAELQQQVAELAPEIELQTTAPRMLAALETTRRAAAADAPVLLRGENGTGKGVLARLLHASGPRAARPFVTVSCPTLSGELLASELFGHARGAFTGAVRDQPGRVETAEGGTLFLDEIAELPPALQAKLLRFLQEHQFERVGETRTRTADVRIVAATNRDLDADVREGRFREDLLYRLNVVEIAVPPLRERREDILPLARHFLAVFARNLGRRTPELAPETQALLRDHAWPGNVRELRNVMERVIILWPAHVVTPEALPERIAPRSSIAAPMPGGDLTLEELEREHVLRVLARAGTQEEAARILGIDTSTLWRKRKRYEGT
jgi:NtrC-family two-component system response regulator AlgB